MSEQQGGSRGQAEVLATVLLFGIVIMAAVALAAVAMGAFGGSQDLAEEQAIERALLELRSASSDVALEGEAQRSVSMELPDGATVEVLEDAGTMTVTHYDYRLEGDDESETLYEKESLGAVVVTHNDKQYALQGGGIFMAEEGYGTMMAPPTIGHRGLTLTVASLPIDGDGFGSGDSTVRLQPGHFERPVFPNDSATYTDSENPYVNPVQNGTVELTVESEFYEGWYDFFNQRTDGSATIDHDNETATAIFESPDEVSVDDPVTLETYCENEHPNDDCDGELDGEYAENAYLPDPSEMIDQELEAASEDNDNDDCIDGNSIECDTLEGGTYYFDGDAELPDELEINTTENVTIAVDGDLHLDDITVTGDEDYGVTYYVSGDMTAEGGPVIETENNDPESHRNVFIIGGQVFEGTEQNPTIHGIIYAPNADAYIQGSIDLIGALYVNSLEFAQGQGSEFTFDEDLDAIDFTIDFSEGVVPITFLHITENTAVASIE